MIDRYSRLACAVLAVLTTAACQSAPPAKPASITFADTQTLPAPALKALAFAQLEGILTPVPPPPRYAYRNTQYRFDSFWLATAPRWDGHMCRYDLLEVGVLADDRYVDQEADTPMHAVDIGATHWFSPAPADVTDCAAHDPATHHYFEVDDTNHVEMAFAMLKDAVARLPTSDPGFTITCDDETGCGKFQVRANPDRLTYIGTCAPAVANAMCRSFSWRAPEMIELYITYLPYAPGGHRILDIRFEHGVTVN